MIAEFIAAAVTAAIGLALLVLGWAFVEAGKGGYGHGPIPMLPVPRDNGLIALGIVSYVLGLLLLLAAWVVVGA